MQWKISQGALRALIAHASKEQSRYAICGVYFAPQGCAVATDGKRLLALPAETDNPDSAGFVLALDDAKRVAKESKKDSTIIFRYSGKMIDVHFDGRNPHDPFAQHFEALPLDGAFPKWLEIMPEPENAAARISLNAHFLRDLADAAILAHDKEAHGPDHLVALFITDARRPILALSVAGGAEMLMPVALESEDMRLPAFAQRPAIATA